MNLKDLLGCLWKGPTSRQRSLKFTKILITLQQKAYKPAVPGRQRDQSPKIKADFSKEFQISQTNCKQRHIKLWQSTGKILVKLTGKLALNTHQILKSNEGQVCSENGGNHRQRQEVGGGV